MKDSDDADQQDYESKFQATQQQMEYQSAKLREANLDAADPNPRTPGNQTQTRAIGEIQGSDQTLRRKKGKSEESS